MTLGQLLEFLKAAVNYAKVDPGEIDNGTDTQDIAYHQRLVRMAVASGVLGLLVGIFSWVPNSRERLAAREQEIGSLPT